jgi:membrane-bound lytic murein transglycosylase B
MLYDSWPFDQRMAELPMRKALSFLCLLPSVFLAACSSSPDTLSSGQSSASRTNVSATAESGSGSTSSAGSGYVKASSSSSLPSYGASRVTGDYAGYASVERFIDRMSREESFDPSYVAGVLSRVERQQWIIDFVTKPRRKAPSRPTGYWNRYRAKFLTNDNIAGGSRFWRRYASVLRRAEAEYGVPAEYVVAIIGVETRYGGYMGKHQVVDALATLAFDFPRRSAFFTDELAAFLVMARDEGFDPFRPKGSYAGAMGYGQFMPSSFHNWAVDFDGDGRRDLWNPVDAIGSVANYFVSHGWRTGEPVTVRARTNGSGAGLMKAGFDTRYGLDALSAEGVSPGGSIPNGEPVSLIKLDVGGSSGYQYWLGLKNFYVITRYNHSSYYAMAVHQLAQAVRKRHAMSGARVSARNLGTDPVL